MRFSQLLHRIRSAPRRSAARRPRIRARLEYLESRCVLSAVPWGADVHDTGEYLLGSVLVTPVFLESTGAIDPSTENWTAQQIAETKQKIQAGVEWWSQTLANYTSIHSLNFEFDFTYADNPVPTRYEPISRVSDDFSLYANDFLDFVGFNTIQSVSSDVRTFNDSQRRAHDTNWAFTIFVVNSAADLDGQFEFGGSFLNAFAFAGGRFIVTPSTRPESTIAHETGHMFWARDEYLGAASWMDERGYYNTQNFNSADNPTPGFVQQDSIMANGTRLQNAFNNHTSAGSTLEMLGWRDSDGDGVFDVLDVPHTLRGSGRWDAATGRYRFIGEAHVNTLPNLNSSGLQNDITINQITRAEYRIDGGAWLTAASYNTSSATLDLSIPVAAGQHQIDIRTVTIDPGTQQLVTSSPIFSGSTERPSETSAQGIHGILWNDVDADGEWDAREIPLTDRSVRIVDANGQPVSLQVPVEPDDFEDSELLDNAFSGITLSAVGLFTTSDDVLSREMNSASTGDRVFAHFLSGQATSPTWTKDSYELQVAFGSGQTYVSIDAIGDIGVGFARLEAYDAFGNLLERYNTSQLQPGQSETMIVSRPIPEIRMVKAFGRANTSVLLDNLRVGHPGSTISSSSGAYWLEDLPPGSYVVATTAPIGSQFTAPDGGRYQLTLSVGDQWEARHFAVRHEFPWQNPNQPLDVNNDGQVTPFDVSLILAELVRSSTRPLGVPTDSLSPAPFWDTKADNQLSPFDALHVLVHIVNGGSGSGESMSSRPAVAASALDDERVEGEAGLDVRPHVLRERFGAEPAPASNWFVRRTNDEDRHAAFDAVLSQWDIGLAVARGALDVGGLERRSQPAANAIRSWIAESAAAPAGPAAKRADSPKRALDRPRWNSDDAVEQALVLLDGEQQSVAADSDVDTALPGGFYPPESAVSSKSGKEGESGELSLK